MPDKTKLASLNNRIIRCKKCPRLIAHCRQTAKDKTARYRHQPYWGRPVPNLLPASPASARLLIVGLAPGAHGANRTGRMFTGDRSGDFLFEALYRAGFCSQPDSTETGDGLAMSDAVITSAAHCAPPGNRPNAEELDHCAGFLDQTFDALPKLRAVLSLGQIAHRAVLNRYRRLGHIDRLNRCPFAHAASFSFPDAPTLLCCYHPSQQNTFTGRLTPDMLLNVLKTAKAVVSDGG